MPELPEVETVARDLRPRITGATIVDARVLWERTLRDRDPEDFAERVIGRRIEAVGRRGKQLAIDLSGGALLTIHLKMTGQLFVVPASAPQDPYVRLVLAFHDGRELRFRDIRKFGKVGLYTADSADPFALVGPEPLDDAFTLAAFRHRIRGRTGRLKPLLLDQSLLAGIGNIYADEALWRARLHPLRSARSLRSADEQRLYEAIRGVLAEAVERRGSSIDDYTAPDGDGSMQEVLDVYQRTGEPCPRCTRPIRRIVVGARATHFCSWCQRLPLADRTRPGTLAALRGITDGTVRRGRRWTELDVGEGSTGLTPDEVARAAARERTARTKRAAATRRAAARATMSAEASPEPVGATPTDASAPRPTADTR